MKKLTKRAGLTLLILMVSLNRSISLKAQTPADDPGIGGPGLGSAPSGDGAPIVPFDGGMSLIVAISGVGYAAKSLKNKKKC